MDTRSRYALAGLVVVGIVDLLINLLAAALQQRAFSDQFTAQSLWVLAGLAVVGILVGFWLGGRVKLEDPERPSEYVKITRLQALFSYIKLRGRGISIRSVFSLGSKIDIDTNDSARRAP